MNEPRDHLRRDFEALRYLDALDSGDMEAVAALWEEASGDPQLERVLAELDGALFAEGVGGGKVRAGREGGVLPKPSPGDFPTPQPTTTPVRPVVWVFGALAAACVLAFLAWLGRDRADQVQGPPRGRPTEQAAIVPPGDPDGVAPLLEARRDLQEAQMPAFAWPVRATLSTSSPLDGLD